MVWQRLTSITQKFYLKSVCFLCNQAHSHSKVICADCTNYLDPIGAACFSCATPLPQSDYLVCGRCIKKKPHVDSMQAAYYFTEPLRSIMHEFKYKGGIYLTQFLAELMLEKTPETILHSECFIPIPLHYKKLRQRGFNQAAELAKYLGKVLGIPVELNCCKKQIMTPAQAELRGVKRRQNLRDVFSISSITYKNITLIDDIITTGSTLNELARMIKKNSAITIHAWGCAKAV